MKTKLSISIDTADWRNQEERKIAELHLEDALDNLNDEEYQAIAGFLFLERVSGGEFDFSNRATGNKYADKMHDLLRTLQSNAMAEVSKNWESYPNGHNLEPFIK